MISQEICYVMVVLFISLACLRYRLFLREIWQKAKNVEKLKHP